MYNLYINILKAFINEKALWVKYKDSIDLKYLREYFPELHKVYLTLFKVYEDVSGTTVISSPTDLQAFFLSFYPASTGEEYSNLFKALSNNDDSVPQGTGSIQVYLESIRKRTLVSALVDVAVGYVEGGVDDERLHGVIASVQDAINRKIESAVDKDGEVFVSLSEDLETEVKGEQGYRWSLPSINGALGSIRKGDFGFIVARPETGKTTFLANQAAYFCTQTPVDGRGCILWINNEERSSKVGFRIRQSLHSQIKRGLSLASEVSFDAALQKIRLPKDLVLQRREVESLCASLNPSLIIIDQLDKIKGFEGDRYDLELKAAYQWARELASKYGPVIGVCQAGASAENKKWVGMGDVDSSKTGKQGEADWILGIGRTDNEDSSHVRYLYLSKNKLMGDADTDPARRHDKWTVKILPEDAMYEDF